MLFVRSIEEEGSNAVRRVKRVRPACFLSAGLENLKTTTTVDCRLEPLDQAPLLPLAKQALSVRLRLP